MIHSKLRFKSSVIALALVAMPAATFSAGLGKITVLSGLGQPLRAEVELSANAEELSSLSAKLASAEAFKQAGIDFSPALSGVKLSVGQRPDGKSVVRVTTDKPVNDPFVDVLLEVTWASGRLVREYTFLLDPPEAVVARQASTPGVAARSAEIRPPSARIDEQTRVRAREQLEKPTPSAAQVSPATKPASRGPASAAGTREVRRGDTLGRIAGETKYEGVSLDQMLVALFQGNRDAFEGNSMHRLKAGRILSVPDRDAVAAVAPSEARRIVVAHAADFSAYRQKLAAAAGAAPEAKEAPAQQIAGGKIAPRVEDKAPRPADAKDELKISKAEAGAEPKADTKPDKAMQSKIAALEEEVLAKDKSLKEATARLSQVEKNIQELQKLIELKNKNLAELQKQAATKAPEPPQKPEVAPVPPPAPIASAPAPAAAPTPPPAPSPADVTAPSAVPAPAAEAPKPAEPAPPQQAEPAPPPAVVEGKPEEAKPPQPAPEAKPEEPKPAPVAEAPVKPATPAQEKPSGPGFLESLTQDSTTLIGVGGVLALLLAYLGYKVSRRRKEQAPMTGMESVAPSSVVGGPSVFGATGGQSVDTSASSIQTDFSQSGIGAIDADEGVDPVAEADVYMAYGRDAQAEEILLDALKTDPTRHAIHVKLLEIYAQRKNLQQFETLASELYAQTSGVGAEWEKASALGRKLDPANPLYGGGPQDAQRQADLSETTVIVPAVASAALKDTWTMPGELGQIASAAEAHGTETSTVILPHPAESKPQEGKETQEELTANLDFDLGAEPPAVVEEKDERELSSTDANAAMLDFDLGVDSARAQSANVIDDVPYAETAVTLRSEIPQDVPMEAEGPDLDIGSAESANVQRPETSSAFASKAAAPAELDLLLTTSITGGRPMGPGSVVDLEATDFGGNLFQDLAAKEAAELAKAEEPSATLDLERTEVGGNLLDFDFNLSEPAPEQHRSTGIDLSGINLDPAGGSAAPMSVPPPSVAIDMSDAESGLPEAESAQEADTKLELAQAYEEMGDKEGARELLQEVLKEGRPPQQDKAREMLAKLS